MNRKVKEIITISMTLLFVLLSGCHLSQNNQENSLDTPSESYTPQDSASGESQPVPPETTPTPSTDKPHPTMDITQEPPLSESDMNLAVPDFLTQEQQMLYRRAHSLYEHLLGDSIEYAETFEDDVFPQREYEQVMINDMVYLVAQGRYANWIDFEEVGHSIFTEKYWEELNKTSDGLPLRTEYNGKLCFLDTSMGGGYYYCEDIPDDFRLEKSEENEIVFTLIGHYRNFEKATDEITTEDGMSGYDYTLEFPIKMILTEDGWRFDEFHSSLRDEREP